MLFKNFNVDGDLVAIDEQKIYRPRYISISQWHDFWAFAPDSKDHGGFEKRVQEEVDSIVSQKEYEHEAELDKQGRELKSSFNKKLDDIERELNSLHSDISDLIDKSRVNVFSDD